MASNIQMVKRVGLRPPTAGNLITVLNIDRGGIRGVIPGVMLQYLESQLQDMDGEEARIAYYFDIIAGTSIGGLVTTMLTAPNENNRPLCAAKDIVPFYLENSTNWVNGSLVEGSSKTKYDGLKLPSDLNKDAQLSDICIDASYLPAHYFKYGDRESNLIDSGGAANSPSSLALGEVTRQIMKANPDFLEIPPLDYQQYLLISLGTGTQKQEPRYDATVAAKWEVFGWLLNNGSTLLIESFTQASADLVVLHSNVVFQALNSVDNYLHIQDETLTGIWLQPIAITDNLNNMVGVGESLLDKPVTRLNSDAGVVEPVPNGGTNAQALKRFAEQLSDERKLRELKYTKGTA